MRRHELYVRSTKEVLQTRLPAKSITIYPIVVPPAELGPITLVVFCTPLLRV